jgi:hypothetical protein
MIASVVTLISTHRRLSFKRDLRDKFHSSNSNQKSLLILDTPSVIQTEVNLIRSYEMTEAVEI